MKILKRWEEYNLVLKKKPKTYFVHIFSRVEKYPNFNCWWGRMMREHFEKLDFQPLGKTLTTYDASVFSHLI